MSTILKALRRLEEDSSNRTARAGSPGTALPATDPLATDELRDRILAEEAAAQAGVAAQSESNRIRRIVPIASAALLVLGLAVGAYTTYRTSPRAGVDSAETALVRAEAPSPEPAAVPKVEDPRAGEALAGAVGVGAVGAQGPTNDRPGVLPKPGATVLHDLAAAQPHNPPEPQTPADHEARETQTQSEQASSDSEPRSKPSSLPVPVPVVVPVVEPAPADAMDTTIAASPKSSSVPLSATTQPPTRSAVPRTAARPTPPPPKAVDERPLAAMTPVVIAEEPRSTVEAFGASRAGTLRTGTPDPRPGESRPSPRRAAPKKAAPDPPPSAFAPEPIQVERLDRRGLPDLTVLNTAWHPSADRRSTRIRLEATNEILTLREGDAIGGLVVQKISPSAVLFKVGDVEVRRRVGQPGSGG